MYNFFLEHFGLPIGDFLNNSSYVKQLRYWRKIDGFSEKQLEQLQKKNLKSILKHANNTIPFYKGLNLNLGSDNSSQWLEQFPILTKETLRKSNTEFLDPKADRLIKYSSSGSSGVQSTIFMNKEEQSIVRAILTHWWEWSGYRIGKPLVQTGITPNRGGLKKLKDLLFQTIYVDAFSHSKKQIDAICKKIMKSNNYFLAGYASSLNVFAEHALENNYKISLQAVISFGDKLFTHYKKNIEKAFQTRVYDTYGCNEGFLIAAEKDIEYKYIMSPHVYLEILDDENKPVPDGQMGHVVVTRLDCYSMPLIRYKIGDLAIKLPKAEYPITRAFNYPLLKNIVGRETDIVYLSDGKKMVVHAFTGIFEYITEIKQFQVIQDKPNSIVINYIKSDNFTESVLLKTTEALQVYIQDDQFKIQYREVNYIASSKSGKPQIIINNLKK